MCNLVSRASDFLFNKLYEQSADFPKLLICKQTIPENYVIDTTRPAMILNADLNNTVCAISQDNLPNCEIRAKLPCDHHFESASLHEWFKKKTVCPLCKADITVEKVQAYVMAINIFNPSGHIKKQLAHCDDLLDKQKKNVPSEIDIKADQDRNKAYPVIYSPVETIPERIAPTLYQLKEPFKQLADNIPFKIVATVFNVVHWVGYLSTKLVSTIVYIARVATAIFIITPFAITVAVALGVPTIPFMMTAYLYIGITGRGNPRFLPFMAISLVVPGTVAFLIPATVLRKTTELFTNIISLNKPSHTPKSIWNDSLIYLPPKPPQPTDGSLQNAMAHVDDSDDDFFENGAF